MASRSFHFLDMCVPDGFRTWATILCVRQVAPVHIISVLGLGSGINQVGKVYRIYRQSCQNGR